MIKAACASCTTCTGLIKAVHRAACCAGVAMLPAIKGAARGAAWHKTSHEVMGRVTGARPATCLNFSHFPRVAPAAACAPITKDVWGWWWSGDDRESCPADDFYLRHVLREVLEWSGLLELPCPSGAGRNDTLVAQVRSGDIFGGDANHSSSDVNLDYGQPGLDYYLVP